MPIPSAVKTPAQILLLTAVFVVSSIHCQVFAATKISPPQSPAALSNEQAIEFQADSGETTNAFSGHIMVTENRNNSASRKIRINYVRFPATGEHKGPPIIYLSGGPGGSGIGTAKWRRYPLFMALRKYGDVIALDQRGTGQSEQAETCVSSWSLPLNDKLDEQSVKRAYTEAAKQCFRQWQQQGIDPYGYTTVQNALDIDDLRQHLGAETVSLWGISYGSHLALAALKLFPQQINKVVIASAEGLDQTVKLPSQTDAYFQRVQQLINQLPLKQQVPDLAKLMKRVHQKLDNQPMTLRFTLSEDQESEILFQKPYLQRLASMMVADPNQYLAMLIQLYLSLDAGDSSLLTHILERGVFSDQAVSFRLMPLAMDVASGISEPRLMQVTDEAKTSLLGQSLNFPMPLLNRFDAKLDLGDDFRAGPKSKVPTLLFTGTLDGRTYPEEQANAVKGLSNLSHITVENGGHNLFTSSPEVLQRMEAFFADQPVSQQPIKLPLPQLKMQ
ncbi:alpha/beta hydrolase [Neiella marina]|uniref:Alpha/beta hydrolase n=1 Tax=Neiella marina TaxID=508461 RepID=A0A8J2U638_9GAMM|nr:alpha/beta hydrolase [Neiella marina]GGA81249.1 alpha/beta hydrolase [Neiella marina]